MTDFEDNIFQLEYNNQLDYTYSTPIKCILFNNEIPGTFTGWSSLYVQILKTLRKQYPDIIKANTFLTERKKRIDLVDKSKIYQIRRCAIIESNLYAEVNLSAKDIISRIFYLSIICGLKKDDLRIFYIKKHMENPYTEPCEQKDKSNNFSKPAITKKGLINKAEAIRINNTAVYIRLKSMASVYDDKNELDIYWIKSKLGLPIDIDDLKIILDEIPWIKKIQEGIYSFSKNIKPHLDFEKESFLLVLSSRYQNGIQFDSIDLENFRMSYNDIIGKPINITDNELENCLHDCGVLYKGRIFPAEGILNDTAKRRLMDYIHTSFNNGCQVLYYKAIYSELKDVFVNCFNLVDEKMLKAYLEYICEPYEFFFDKDYMTKEKNIKLNHSFEIENYLKANGKPLSYEEIYTGLSNVSKNIIINEIRSNPNILLNEKERYFHIDIFDISSEEMDMITSFIRDDIENYGYCIWSSVFTKIKTEMPIFIENNVYLSSLGIRKAVARKLSGRFDFENEVICHKGAKISMADVYRLYGQHHAPFSDDDLYAFSREINGGNIYFDSLSETTARVSKNLFVSRDDICFDVEATDNAISTYLETGYMLIRDIDSFLVFPNVGYEWNEYLLETYLMYFSKKYILSNNGRSLNNVAGAVVRRGSGFDEFADVCADAIAKSGCELTNNKVLDYLGEVNLLTRRSYKKIDSVLVKAKQIRNRKE